MTEKKRSWTVAELIAYLQTLPQNMPVVLSDADTCWTIPTFDIIPDVEGEVMFDPCDYSEMRR